MDARKRILIYHVPQQDKQWLKGLLLQMPYDERVFLSENLLYSIFGHIRKLNNLCGKLNCADATAPVILETETGKG